MTVTVERYIKGKMVKVPLSEAAKPIPKTDEQRLQNYRAQRGQFIKDKKDGIV